MAIEDTWNIVTLGYGSERAEIFRGNDGKGPLEQAGTVLERGGSAIGNAGAGLYSLADLIVLNALPDSEDDVYQDNHALVRPFLFVGRVIGDVWKATEAIGNTLTWGLFDNVSGSAGMLVEDAVEVAKHTGEAVTNLARGPGYLIAGRNDGSDAVMDWILLVPLEFASNAAQMKGIANMEDYETAFAQKGVIGSILELGGSAYIAYEVIDEIVDELDDDDNGHSADSGAEPPTPPDDGGSTPPTSGFYLGADGTWYYIP